MKFNILIYKTQYKDIIYIFLMAKYLSFINDPIIKFEKNYCIAYSSFFFIWSSLIILICIMIPETYQDYIVMRSALIISSFIFSILLVRCYCFYSNELEDQAEEETKLKRSETIVWYNE